MWPIVPLIDSSVFLLLSVQIGTVEIWRNVFRSIKSRLRRKPRDKPSRGSNEVGSASTRGSPSPAEVVHHPEKSADLSTVC